jgi:two-component system, NarL family, sensor histidine kinase DesK
MSATVRLVSGLESLHRYTRLTLLATLPMVGAVPLLLAMANGAPVTRLAPLAVVIAVLLPVHWGRIKRSMAAPAEALPWRPLALGLALTVTMMAYGYGFADPGNVMWAFLPAMSLAELQFGRDPGSSWRLAAGVTAVIAGLAGLLAAVVPSAATRPVVAAGVTAFVLVTVPWAELVALRQWRIAVELDQARRDAAELGATRERLRFAEDLHDILGHALEVVSRKSELAARLGAVDPERAHAEMVEVQRLARGALQDVRELVVGRRSTDLETELTGARSLLTSAGIDCVVDVEPVAPAHTELFGRVLREAVTNLLRHADTRHCWITVRPTTLSVVNDGVTVEQGTGGTGLAGLSRRVGAAGGTFTAGPGERPGTFAVEAVLS